MIPVDIIFEICSSLGPDELAKTAVLSRTWNEGATSILYRHIDLDRPRAIWRCVNVLSLPPGSHSYGRDLAVFPQSVRLRQPLLINIHEESAEALSRTLTGLLPRLINLRSFSCGIPLPNVTRILLCATQGCIAPLEELELTSVPGGASDAGKDISEGDVPPRLGSSHTDDPTLLSLKLYVLGAQEPAPYISFLKGTICLSPAHIRSLTLSVDALVYSTSPTGILDVLWGLPILVNLEELHISARCLSLPCFALAPHLRALRVDDSNAGQPILDPAAFPVLEELSCPARMLDAFLPQNAPPGSRRPIHTIRIGHASYERFGGQANSPGPLRTYWTTDRPGTLAPLTYSGVPVRHLTTYAGRNIALRLSGIRERLSHLESLVLVVEDHGPFSLSLRALGATFLAHMPRLHTFLLSDAYMKRGGPYEAFPWARDEALQSELLAEYEKHTSALRRVAFTSEFEWEKRDDGEWHAWGHVFLDLPMLFGWKVRLDH